MSHFSTIKIKIKNPNIDLLKNTVNRIAQETGGQIVEEIRDANYNTLIQGRDFVIGFTNDTFYRGVGIRIDENGEVRLVGDFWRVSQEGIEKFKQLLVQRYASEAMKYSLMKLGYKVQEQKVQNKIVIHAMEVM
ncbi:DUF1257 domain-containing protein [Candidatus Methanodesulfokora washburnensis]|nr:DUF1257 domain-containing protein [Candidatus Methanodesulfokores washburnensis]